MFKSTVFFLLVCFLGIHGHSYEEQGYQHNERLGGWLKMQARPRTWRVARIQCHLEGAFLATPWSPEFVAAINQLQNSYRGKENVSAVYSGVFETDPEGAYSVIEGSLTISLDPRDMAQYERCGVIFANGTTSALSCKHRLPFVCFAPRTSTSDLDPPAFEQNLTSAPVASTQDPVSTLAPDVSTQDPVPTLTPDFSTQDPVSTVMLNFSTQDAVSTVTPDGSFQDPVSTLTPKASSILVSVPTTCDERAGYEYSRLAESCYKVFNERAVWTDANLTCQRDGAHLTVINSDDESWAIAALMRKSLIFNQDILYGVYRNQIGEWVTVTGEPLSQTGWGKWDENEPDGGEIWRYGNLNRYGKLYTGTNILLRPFICEKAPQASYPDTMLTLDTYIQAPVSTLIPDISTEEPALTLASQDYYTDDYDTTSFEETSTPVSTPTSCDKLSGYKYESLTESCYKIHSERAVWTDANSTCVEEGAHLLVINSEDEAWVITKLIRTKVLNSEAVSVGVYRQPGGQWMTATDEPHAELQWGYQETDNGLEWRYAFFLRDEIYTGANNYLRPFICEAPHTLYVRSS